MMKGLMGRCLHHEMDLERVRVKANSMVDELSQLKTWKSNMEKKFNLSEKIRNKLEQGMEEAKKVLEDKDKEIQDLKDQPHQAKEVAIREYRNSDALLSELGDSFLEGFDDTLRHVKKAYPNRMCPTSKLKTKAKPPSRSSPRKTLRIFLLKTQLKATESQPRRKMLKVKPNL